MNYRVSDNSASSNFGSQINAHRNRLNILQERILTGKRINRPSDDPSGAGAVIRLRTSQTEIGQFQRNAQTANQKLTAADSPLDNYQNNLERVKTLVSQGFSDTTTQTVRNSLAVEIETLRGKILNVANSTNGDEFIFGGTRQNAPPFDQTTAVPANTPSTAQYIQIEPGANAIAVGITAETLFSDANSTVFTDLTAAAAAMRGTGNAAADKLTLETTIRRLDVFRDLAINGQTRIGANMNVTDSVAEILGDRSLSFDGRIEAIEGAELAETALAFTEAGRALDATLQVAAKGRRSLFDFI